MNNKLWNASLFLALVKPMPIMFFAAIFTIIGLFDLDIVLLIGIVLWVVYFSVSLFCFLRMQYWINYRCDNEDFNNLMNELTDDPDNFLKKRFKEYDSILHRRGEELLSLSDGQLLDTVITQTAIMMKDKSIEFSALSPSRRTVYVLFSLDSDVMNGGLFQFFVNSPMDVVMCVPESLETVGANEHRELFDKFLIDNSINLSDCSCLKEDSKKEYLSKEKWFDYDKFNNEYYNLPSLKKKIIKYIRANIEEL